MRNSKIFGDLSINMMLICIAIILSACTNLGQFSIRNQTNEPIISSNATNTIVLNTLKSCIDDDNGKNIFQKGLINNDENYSDFCDSKDSLIEYYCKNTDIVKESINCPSNYVCKSGECVQTGSVSVVSCTDSDGVDSNKKGYVTMGNDTYKDVCLDTSKGIEYYCATNGTVASENFKCNVGFSCFDGKCQAVDAPKQYTCAETDTGFDIEIAATTTKGAESKSDSCLDANNLLEYYCLNNNITLKQFNCGAGFVCKNGACIIQKECSDPDGSSYLIAGTTTKGAESKSDSCQDIRNGFEYLCDANDNIILSEFVCGDGYKCSAGKCDESCIDRIEQGEKDIFRKGSSVKGTTSKTDYCSGGVTLFEYYCDANNNIIESKQSCPQDFECSDGACVKAPTCTEDDGGNNIYNAGTTTRGTVSKTDYCASNGITLVEYYCSNNYIVDEGFTCPEGFGCHNGFCEQLV